MPPARQDETPEYPFAGPFPGLQSEVAPSQIGNAGFAEVQNLLFRNSKAQIVPEFVPVSAASPFTDPTEQITGFFDFFDIKARRHSGIFGRFGMYQHFGGAWLSVPPSTTAPPSEPNLPPGQALVGVSPNLFMQSAVVGYRLYFSNPVNTIQVWDGVAAGYNIADNYPPPMVSGYVPGHIQPVAAKYLMELDFHLLAANLTALQSQPTLAAGTYPNSVMWSAIGNGSDWSSFSAGINELGNNLGPINGMTRLFQSGYIFQQWGVTQVVPTGQGLAPFQWISMGAYAKGNIFPYSLASFGELIACYVGRDDVYIFDGTSSQPIGQHPIDGNRRLGARRRIFEDLFLASQFTNLNGGNSQARVCGVILTAANDKTHESYWLFIPELNKAWVYNFDESNWTQLYFQPQRLLGPAASAFYFGIKDPTFNPVHPSGFTFKDSLVIADNVSNNASYLDFNTPGTVPTIGSINSSDTWYIRSGPLDFDDNRHPHSVNKLRIVLTDVAAGMQFFIRLMNDAGYSTPVQRVTLGENNGQPITVMVNLANSITGKYITWELSGPPGIPFELVEITPYPILGGEVMTRCEVLVAGGPGTGILISISPGSATVAPGGTQQFTATVTGTTNRTVNWTADQGTIDSNGLFTAPNVTAATTVTITATSAADLTASSSVRISVQPTSQNVAVYITPIGGTVTESQTLQFSATVTNTANVAVTWTVDVGSISSTGLFTAPPVAPGSPVMATITATSLADPNASAVVQVTVMPSTGPQLDLLLWTVMSPRATQHLSGDPKAGYDAHWLDTDAGYPTNFPSGVIWYIKNALGHPWDVCYYDNNYALSHWMTENGDQVDDYLCQAANGTTCWMYAKAYKRNLHGVHILPRYFTSGTTITIDNPAPNDFVRTTDCEQTSTLIHLGPVRSVTTGPFKISWGGSIDAGAGSAGGPNYDPVNGVDTIKNQYMFTQDSTQPSGYASIEETYYVLGFGRVAWFYYVRGVLQNQTINTVLVSGGHPTPNFPCGPGQPWFGGAGPTVPPNITYPNLETKTNWVVSGGTTIGGTDPNPTFSMQQGVALAGQTNTMQLNLQSAAGLWGDMQVRWPPPNLASQLPVPPSGLIHLDGMIYPNQGTNAIAAISFDTNVAQNNQLFHMGWKIDYQQGGLLLIQDSTHAWVSTGIVIGQIPVNQWSVFQTAMSINWTGPIADRLMFTLNGVQYPIPGTVAQMSPTTQAWTNGVSLQLTIGTNSSATPIIVNFVNLGYTY